MTESALPAQPFVPPPQVFQLGPQAPGLFSNHIMVGTDGTTVFITFSQATPALPYAMPLPDGETQKFQNMPMVASPVAKIVLVPKILPQLIQSLQELSRQLEKQQSP